MKKGVYVENLSEFEVRTVGDILRLLIQVINYNYHVHIPSVSPVSSPYSGLCNLTVTYAIQGSSNRKVAATNMNRESSRSHSVFTCVIESRREKDSGTNLRYARLNLVDLAGSER